MSNHHFQIAVIGSGFGGSLMAMIAQGTFKPVIDRVLPLEQAREGLRLIQDREVIGKVVIRP